MQQPPKEPIGQTQDFWSRHLSWQRPFEIAIWVLVFGIAAAANVAVILIDAHRDGLPIQAWQPLVSEGSSALASLLLVPLLLRLCERWPLHAETWLRRLPIYALASVGWSLLHVVGMVLLRNAAYALMGDSYSYDWWIGLPYEYIKDVQTFSMIVFVAHGYSWLWRRLQGEAHLLGAPDPGIPAPREAQGELPERFLVRKLGREFLIAADDIEWLQASSNYVNLHVAGRAYPLRSTLSGIEARLDTEHFVRIHRSYLVNLGQIESIEPLDTGDARIHLRDGTALPCSRSYREAIRSRFGATMGNSGAR